MESNEIIYKMKTKENCCAHPIWALLHLIEANVIREKKHRRTYRKKYTSLALKFIFGSNSHCYLFHFSMKTKRSNWYKKTINYNGSVCGSDANGTEEKKSAYRRKIRDILSLHRIQPACNYVLSLSLFMFPVETEVATVLSEKMLAKGKKTALATQRNMRATKQR